MCYLDINWTPGFGDIYVWFAQDRFGRIAKMTNNCWGDIPKCLLAIKDIDNILTDISEYIWEESSKFKKYPENKKGDFFLDMYCHWRYDKYPNKEAIIYNLREDFKERENYSDANIPINKGIFIYEAIEGNKEGEDYPVGYEGHTKMGDYFRFLCPTIFGSIEDFPKELWHGIAVSDTLDFMENILLDNSKINLYFPRTYC
jgi:hypothetical protein